MVRQGGGHPADDEASTDVFGPGAADDEIFEWVGDDGPDHIGETEGGPSLRERADQVRATVGKVRERRVRRRLGTAAAALAVAAGAAVGFTAWFDAVASAADKADVFKLAVDSVVDGDPAQFSYTSSDKSATVQYVVEIANDGPDQVTLTNVSFDAGTMMSSTAWKPLGGAVIPGGGTAKVALAGKVFCPMLLAAESTGGGSGSQMTFPTLDVTALTLSGDFRSTSLPTRVMSGSDPAPRSQPNPDQPAGARVVAADDGVCRAGLFAEQLPRAMVGQSPPFRTDQGTGLAIKYLGVSSAAAAGKQSYVMDFAVTNGSKSTKILGLQKDHVYGETAPVTVGWMPLAMTLAPGQTLTGHLTVMLPDCSVVGIELDPTSMVQFQVSDPAVPADTTAGSQIVPDLNLSEVATGGVRLELDAEAQSKAACP